MLSLFLCYRTTLLLSCLLCQYCVYCRKDILPKRQLAENREILGIVSHFSKMCNSQSLCNYKITIVRSLPYIYNSA